MRKQFLIEALDMRHSEALGVNEGDILNWEEAKQKLRDKIKPHHVSTLCKGCSWQKYGVCENALLKNA